jgi:hypothetical protein
MIDWLEHHLLACPIKSNFGLDCPGCGSQRAFISLLKGNLMESLNYHAALIPSVVTIAILILQLIKKYDNGGKLVMWCFIVTSGITFIQYITKQMMLFY